MQDLEQTGSLTPPRCALNPMLQWTYGVVGRSETFQELSEEEKIRDQGIKK